MGNFYTNISLKTSNQQAIVDFMNEHRRRAFISPAENGYICVFDELCDNQDGYEISKLGKALSKHLNCAAISVLNHDDDIFWYQVYQNGKVLDEYNSTPGYFSGSSTPPQIGDPSILCEVFGVKGSHHLTEILESRSMFAMSTHEALADFLGLPAYSIGLGYTYIAQGDLRDYVTAASDDDDDDNDDEREESYLGKIGFVETPSKVISGGNRTGTVEQAKPKSSEKTDEILYWAGFGDHLVPSGESDLEGYLNRATHHLLIGEYDDAIADFSAALAIKSDYPEAYFASYNRGLAKSRKGDSSGAIKDFLATLKLKSDCEKTKKQLTNLLSSSP